jgi:multiple sugar transport system substrate-binding protein
MTLRKLVAAAALASTMLAGQVSAGEIVINTDMSDPAPKRAFAEVLEGFKKAHPDVTVKWNEFDHEGYKSAINNFLKANPPDIAAWYAGNRMAPQVRAGLFTDVTELWAKEGLNDTLKAAASSMTIDGKKWGVPYTYYQWGVYYRKDIFEKNGIAVPKTWAEFTAAAAKLKAAGITPIAIGIKALWPTAGWFDYLNLRVNGYEFHMDLTAGKVPYTDPRVKAVFERWGELVRMGAFLENHAAIDWQDALPQLAQGRAGMYLIGNFAVAPLKAAGLTNDTLGFFQFPEITPGIPKAEDAPTDTLHIPSGAKNKADAMKFLAYVARADVQAKWNATLGQLPVNNKAPTPDDPFLKAGFEMLSRAHGLAQFYDRDAPAEMAKAGMQGFQEFMLRPDNLDRILQRLEQTRKDVYQ